MMNRRWFIIYYFIVIFSVMWCKFSNDKLKSKLQKVSLARPV